MAAPAQDRTILDHAHPLTTDADLDPLLDRIGEARFVLLGEASHGTSEYYQWRSRLSKRLIEEKGFTIIAVEGDWTPCYQVNRWIKGYADSEISARGVLDAFDRWPTWMWANWEIVALVDWLRRHNSTASRQVGFYGLDMYGLWESLEEINRYLHTIDGEAAAAARRALVCFQPFDRDVQAYAWATRLMPTTCEQPVIDLLRALRDKAPRYDGDAEAAFNAEQNARVALEAERYYRAMAQGGSETWNIRDTHMADTLEHLIDHYGGKAIIWEHNTHIGDARATDMAGAGMVNIGQLIRERRSDEGVVLVGFGGYTGSVIAGREWGAPLERMTVPDVRAGSWEALLHDTLGRDALLVFDESPELRAACRPTRGHRAIGVVYNPEHERWGNYVPTSLSRRYDAFIHLEQTQALHPLHGEPSIVLSEAPETYPWGV